MSDQEMPPEQSIEAPPTPPALTPDHDPVPAAAPTGVTSAAAAASGVNGPFPAELHGWNWGAFFFTWIWGLAHSVWISLVVLLSFIPIIGWILGFGMSIALGLKGNEWAWQHRKFESVEQFKKVQHAWAKWALWFILLGLAGVIASIAIAALGHYTRQ